MKSKSVPVTFSLVVVALMIVGFILLRAKDGAKPFRVSLSDRMQWVWSGAWWQGKLLLLDPKRQAIVQVEMTGSQRILEIEQFTERKVEWITSIQGGPGVEVEDGDFFRITETGETVSLGQVYGRYVQSKLPEPIGTPIIGGVNSWAATSGHFYIFGQVKYTEEVWSTGFLRVPRDRLSPAVFVLDEHLVAEDPRFDFYRLGLGAIAADDERAYLLVMEDRPFVLVAENNQVTKRIPLDTVCGRRPDIVPLVGSKAEVAVYSTLEQSEGPFGLYQYGGYVYVLFRRLVNGDLMFFLAQIDPDSGVTLGVHHIVTDAAHLSVVPGDDYWAFIEKGKVELVAEDTSTRSRINSILFYPTADLVDSAIGSDIEIVSPGWFNQFARAVWEEREWLFSGTGLFILAGARRFVRHWRPGLSSRSDQAIAD